MSTLVNAAPMTIPLGTQDKSTRALVLEPEALPTHLPKVYLLTKKGPLEPQLVSGNARSEMYGADSFDIRQKWATHATVLSNLINEQGNAQMIQRVVSANAKTASLRLSLDLAECTLPVYERNSDGSIKYDNSNAPIATGTTVSGYRGKWILDAIGKDLAGNDTFGIATQKAGDQNFGTQSIRYPIMDFRVASLGAYGNDLGIRIWAPTVKSSNQLDERILSDEGVYPFRISCISRKDSLSTAKLIETQYAEQYVDVCFKQNVINKNTDTLLFAEDVFLQAYQNLDNPTMAPQYGPFGEFKVYTDNLDTITDLIYTAEFPNVDEFSDLTTVDGSRYLINLISGVSSQNVPYTAYEVVVGTTNSVRLSENSNLFAIGGEDGDVDETIFANLVTNEVTEYANPNSVLQNKAKYPESIIYDSGFPLDTKYALINFIAERKDTAVVISTHDVLGPTLSASEESALAIALRTRLQMFPESEYYGTHTMRGMIIGRSGILMNNQYRKRLPLTLEFAVKAAKYMGASNGKWKSGFSFDMAPANNVTMFTDINVTFTPATVRNKDWANGLNWVESFSRRSYYFPAFKTVYDNDTSVLNSFFTMMACVELQKVGERAHRAFTGVSSLTNAQLIERVNNFVVDNTVDRFDGRFVITPKAYFTQADIARGYSWTLPIEIYAPNMKTVSILSIEAYRIEDLAQ